MAFDTDLWMRRLKDVEREFLAARFATLDTIRRVRLEPYVLVDGVKPNDLSRSAENLEGTYTVRLFSEFETGLKAYWRTGRKSQIPSRARDFIQSVAAYRGIPSDWVTGTHSVRVYRNFLVHQRDDDIVPIPLAVSRGHLTRFLSCLR